MNRLLPIALMALAAFVVSGCVGAGYYYGGGYAYDPYWPFRHYYYPYFHHFRVPWPRYYPYPLRPWPGYRRPYRRPVPWPASQPSYRSGLQPEAPGVRAGSPGEWHRRESGRQRPGGRRGGISGSGGSAVMPIMPVTPPKTPGARHREGARERAAPPFRLQNGNGERSRSGSPPARTFDAPRPGSDDGGRPRRGGFGGGHRPRRP